MKKTFVQFLKIAGFLALGVLLLYLAFRGVALDELGQTLRQARYGWIALSCFFAFISFFSRARRWMLLVEALGYKPSFWNTYHSLMVGYLSNFALPRLGEITRCVTLNKKEQIPTDALIGTVIVERVIDVVMLLLILLVLLLSWMERFGTFFGDMVFGPLKLKITGAFGGTLWFWLLVLGVLLLVALLGFAFRAAPPAVGPGPEGLDFLKGIADGLKTI
ncbi:MAG: lysylphosphatidylglycerol synthase transmembrane domain-containing protein [Bacteroidales bacterium]